MRKRLLSLAVALTMLLSLLPATALAAEVPPAPTGMVLKAGLSKQEAGGVPWFTTRPMLMWENDETSYIITGYDENNRQTFNVNGGGAYQFAHVGGWITIDGSVPASRAYKRLELAFRNNEGQEGPQASLDVNLTIKQVESTETLTLVQTGEVKDTDWGKEAPFALRGLPANTSVSLYYKGPNGESYGSSAGSNDNGVMEVKDQYSNTNQKWGFNLGQGVVAEGAKYYADVFTIETSGDQIISTITRHPVEVVFDERPAQDLVWELSSGSSATAPPLTVNRGNNDPGYTAKNNTSGGGAITYSSSNEAVATVNASTGVITAVGEGVCTITATAAAFGVGETGGRKTAITYTLTVVDNTGSKPPVGLRLGMVDGDTVPYLFWADREGWSGRKVYFYDGANELISGTDGWADLDGCTRMGTSLADLGKPSGSYDGKKIELQLKQNAAEGDVYSEKSTLNVDFPITSTRSTQTLTAVYTGETTENGSTYANFKVDGVPSSKSMEVTYNLYYAKRTYKTAAEVTQNGYTFQDLKLSENEWNMGLGDLDDSGSTYELLVYDGAVTNDTTASLTITRYPLDFVFDSREAQNLSWSAPGPLNITYGDAGAGLTATNSTLGGGAITYKSSDETIATVDASTGKITTVKAGTCTITATAAAVGTVEDGYRETAISYTLSIGKKVPTAGDFDITLPSVPAFDGNVKAATVTAKSGIAGMGDVTVKYNSTAAAPTNAGSYTVTFDVAEGINYQAATGLAGGSFTVTKATAPAVEPVAKSLLYSQAHTDVAVDITGLPANCGTTSFTVGNVTDSDSILNGTPTATATGIQFSTNSGTAAQTATIPVTVTMQNYENVTVNVVVTLVDKTEVTITGVTAQGKTYDGTALTYSGTPANEQGYTGEYQYLWNTQNGSAPKDAGTYALTVKISDDNADYMGELVISNLVIAPKAITAKPKNISIYNGEALPTSFELEYSGIVTGDTVTVTGTPAFALQKQDGTALENSSTNGSYVIKWTNADEITLANDNYTITKGDGTLTISSRPSGGGGTVTPPPTNPDVVTGGGSSTATIETKPISSGDKTSASVSTNDVKNAIQAAEEAAAKSGTKPALEIRVETPQNAKELEVTLPKSAVADAANSKAESLTITSGVGEITISAETLDSIAKQAGGSEVKISVGAVDTQKALNDKQRTAVGDAPVYDISIQSGGKHITGFDGGLMTISLPYTLKPDENPAGVVVWYVNEQGNIESVTTMYDVKTKTVIFTTNHLSLYAIGYDETRVRQNPFTDVAEGTYYYDAVLWAVSQQVTSGTAATTFSPNAACTRAQVVTFLWNAMGKPAPTSSVNPFTDVNADSYYYDAVLWAAEKGITGGTSATTFSPDTVVTRSQFVTFLHRAAGKPAPAAVNPFADVTDTGAYYYDAVLWAYGEKVTSGTSATTFSPEASCTRAQVVTFLYNYMGK